MAAIVLQGVRIVPRGNRFQTQVWQNGQAFGGWIYSADVNIGLSQSPTTVSIGVVLANIGEASSSVVDFDPAPIKFDIEKSDLILGSPNGTESLFDIYVNGQKFEDFVLYSYEKDIQADKKILTVEFRDYSLILDKIYVGLINRQGNKFVHRGIISGEFSVKCPDCRLDGSSFVENASLVRDVSFGSYAGLNGLLVDNFASVAASLSTASSSSPVTPSPSSANPLLKFNLNGGYLMIGTEDIPQSNCGSVPEVKYSFPELVWSLKTRGIKLTGAFPTGYDTQSKYYRQNYVGTLREVFQNWCSDFAIDFHTSGKHFDAFSIKEPIDISSLTGVLDPNTVVGANFDLTSINAVNSYKESASLDNSFEQSVITYQVKQTEVKTTSKSFNRHVGYIPMHPVDFNYTNVNIYNFRKNSYGLDFIAEAHVHNFDVCNRGEVTNNILTCSNQVLPSIFVSAVANRYNRFHRWTNRTFGDLDTSIALSKYNDSLRDIFAGTRIIESLGVLDPSRNASYNIFSQIAKDDLDANFKALGFHPLARVTDPQLKSQTLVKFKSNNAATVMDSQFFEIYVGYYYPEEHSALKTWEATCAESMYKYGFLVQGTHNAKPYVSSDYFYNLSPEAGLVYGEKGIKKSTYSHTYEPSTEQYPALKDAPFKDLIPFTGIHPIERYSGAYIGQLDNVWGTTKEDFDKRIEFQDTRCQQYPGSSVNERLQDLDATTKQTWDISYFAPSFHSDMGDELYGDYEEIFQALSVSNRLGTDQIAAAYYNNDGQQSYLCRKLHLCIIPITFGHCNASYACHPNARFSFNSNCGLRTNNPEMYLKYQGEVLEEQKRKAKEEIPSICDISVEQELCKKALIKRRNDALSLASICVYDQNDTVSKYFCEIDPTGTYRAGFHPSYLDPLSNTIGNSRFLDVSIERNPMKLYTPKFLPSDDDGNTYLEDLNDPETLSVYEYAQRNARIIYPIDTRSNNLAAAGNFDAHGHLYYGLMTTNVKEEIRAPQNIEIYGEPVNSLNNNSSSIKVINNEVTSNLDPILDAASNSFLSYTSLISPSGLSSIVTLGQYHDVVKSLNDNSSNKPLDSISFSILGEPSTGIVQYLTPKSGLSSYSLKIGDDGVRTELSFISKPKTLPKQDMLLNSITARLPK